jgi:hypothetical protein
MRDHPGPFRPLCVLVLLAAPGAFAQQSGRAAPQGFDVTAFAGYQLNGDATLSGGELEIGDSALFGAAFDLRVHPAVSLELSWHYTKPTERFRAFNSQFTSSRPFSVATHYFQLGAMYVRNAGRRVEPYFGLTVGAALHLPDAIPLTDGATLESGATWRLALAIMLGTKIWLTPNVGLRLEGRVFGPVVFGADDFYAGTAGAGMAAPSSIPYLQFAFTVGLAFGK